MSRIHVPSLTDHAGFDKALPLMELRPEAPLGGRVIRSSRGAHRNRAGVCACHGPFFAFFASFVARPLSLNHEEHRRTIAKGRLPCPTLIALRIMVSSPSCRIPGTIP